MGIRDRRLFGAVLTMGLLLLLASAAGIYAQESPSPWLVSLHLAGMNPQLVMDRWYVTSEGYHVHPACEDFTPGLSFEFAYRLYSTIQAGGEVLYGRAPAFLGMIDDNSSREFNGQEPLGFLAILISPILTLPMGEELSLLAGPVLGYGWLREVRVNPDFGPAVVFGGNSEVIYGGKVGMKVGLGESSFSFSGQILALSMTLDLAEEGLNQEMSKRFGPLGLLAGISYAMK